MLELQFHEERRQPTPPERERRGDPEKADDPIASSRHLGLGFLDLRKDPGAAAVERRALFGQRQPTRGAIHQPHAEALLQPRELATDDGQRKLQIPRRARKAARVDHANEHEHVEEVVGHSC